MVGVSKLEARMEFSCGADVDIQHKEAWKAVSPRTVGGGDCSADTEG